MTIGHSDAARTLKLSEHGTKAKDERKVKRETLNQTTCYGPQFSLAIHPNFGAISIFPLMLSTYVSFIMMP